MPGKDILNPSSRRKIILINVDDPAPYIFDRDAILIAIDVEWYERNPSWITEVGLATLDTRDLIDISPGKNGQNWRQLIRPRHIRVKEYLSVINEQFIQGCPDRFEFGISEIVARSDVAEVLSSCFKHPYSGPEEVGERSSGHDKRSTNEFQNLESRNIVLVGHGIHGDINALAKIGFYCQQNIHNRINSVDTTQLYQKYSGENNPRSVQHIAAQFGITPWNVHNAGNDAVYTMQMLLAITVKAASGREVEYLSGKD
jgi:hypothetical protein